jgi:hypothetical protein
MSFSARLSSSIAALLLAISVAGSARAADQKAALDKIKAHHQAAISAFGASDFEEMKSKLMEAVALGNESGLGKAKIMAQTYVLLGVLQVDGFKDTEAGVRFFAKALDINPAVQIPQGMGTKAVKAAFKRAEDEDVPADDGAEQAEKAPEKPKGPTAAEKKRADAEAAAEKRRADNEAAAEKKRNEAEAREQREKDRQDKAEKDKLMEELAQAKVSESLGAAEKEKLQRERQERDRQLGDNKSRIALLEKDRADRDKQIADRDKQLTETKARVAALEKDKADRDRQITEAKAHVAVLEKDKADRDKQIAAGKDSESKERAAKEKLLQEKPEREKQLADAKARIQQLEKDKADRDKWLAATKDSENKERAAKEKLQVALQDAATRDKERKAKEDEERQEREKAEAGPDLPGHIGEPITCTIPDEIPAATDLYVHCVPRPGVGAKVVALYYRPSGSVVYNALTMDRSKKGWYVAMIPGSKISGRLLQYYVEARDGRETVAASNGKASSPNIATVKSGGGVGRRGKSR